MGCGYHSEASDVWGSGPRGAAALGWYHVCHMWRRIHAKPRGAAALGWYLQHVSASTTYVDSYTIGRKERQEAVSLV